MEASTWQNCYHPTSDMTGNEEKHHLLFKKSFTIFAIVEMQSGNDDKDACLWRSTLISHQPLCQRFISISPPVAWVGEPIRFYRSAKPNIFSSGVGKSQRAAGSLSFPQTFTCFMPQTCICTCTYTELFIEIIKVCRWMVTSSANLFPVNWLLRKAIPSGKCAAAATN